ncbi:MAG: NAD(P)/FAD-dependent oxidoreductase [Myxococcales bacterium]|nr:NAD(P)/FAD-dependent oxidoreductase [Myxococcales bacterium]
MSAANPDALVIGAGPNGLVAANRLADAGLRVLVCEQHPTRLGGACATEDGAAAGTRAGFLHDVGAGFFPFNQASPAFAALDLAAHGLGWAHAPIESCHPAPGGAAASIHRDDDATAASLGGRDGERWRDLLRWHRDREPRLMRALLGPLPGLGAKLALGPLGLLRLARIALGTTAGLGRRLFTAEPARRLFCDLALHVDLGPDDPFGAALGYMLAATAATGGNAVPVGGAGAITAALARRLEAKGGAVRLSAAVERIVVDGGAARAVVLADGEVIESRRILADTGAPALLLRLLPEDAVPARIRRAMRRFRWGWGTFKLDWALAGPVPWSSADARRAAVVHVADSVDDLRRFTAEVRGGALPAAPFLVVGQQSLADPSRAPAGQHTLWAYSRVPPRVEGGWSAARERFADRVEARIEAHAPGFRSLILARRAVSPPDLEAFDPNLVGGDLGGGSNHWRNQLVLRPVFPYFRYTTPVRGVYLASSYAHPGAGVHGMCGWNAAGVALERQP